MPDRYERFIMWLTDPVSPGYEADLDHLAGRLLNLNVAGRFDHFSRLIEIGLDTFQRLGEPFERALGITGRSFVTAISGWNVRQSWASAASDKRESQCARQDSNLRPLAPEANARGADATTDFHPTQGESAPDVPPSGNERKAPEDRLYARGTPPLDRDGAPLQVGDRVRVVGQGHLWQGRLGYVRGTYPAGVVVEVDGEFGTFLYVPGAEILWTGDPVVAPRALVVVKHDDRWFTASVVKVDGDAVQVREPYRLPVWVAKSDVEVMKVWAS